MLQILKLSTNFLVCLNFLFQIYESLSLYQNWKVTHVSFTLSFHCIIILIIIISMIIIILIIIIITTYIDSNTLISCFLQVVSKRIQAVNTFCLYFRWFFKSNHLGIQCLEVNHASKKFCLQYLTLINSVTNSKGWNNFFFMHTKEWNMQKFLKTSFPLVKQQNYYSEYRYGT